jgi:hypothetical protein
MDDTALLSMDWEENFTIPLWTWGWPFWCYAIRQGRWLLLKIFVSWLCLILRKGNQLELAQVERYSPRRKSRGSRVLGRSGNEEQKCCRASVSLLSTAGQHPWISAHGMERCHPSPWNCLSRFLLPAEMEALLIGSGGPGSTSGHLAITTRL